MQKAPFLVLRLQFSPGLTLFHSETLKHMCKDSWAGNRIAVSF